MSFYKNLVFFFFFRIGFVSLIRMLLDCFGYGLPLLLTKLVFVRHFVILTLNGRGGGGVERPPSGFLYLIFCV